MNKPKRLHSVNGCQLTAHSYRRDSNGVRTYQTVKVRTPTGHIEPFKMANIKAALKHANDYKELNT